MLQDLIKELKFQVNQLTHLFFPATKCVYFKIRIRRLKRKGTVIRNNICIELLYMVAYKNLI
jgi:hypothetical protein